MHKIIIRESVTVPEDGLILGNGDISVSVYQCGGSVVFRLGKGDVWDTRLQLDKNPKPAHIAELTDMLATKGLSCKALGSAVSNRNALSARQNELCNSMPAILDYPYPLSETRRRTRSALSGRFSGIANTPDSPD